MYLHLDMTHLELSGIERTRPSSKISQKRTRFSTSPVWLSLRVAL